MFNTKFLIILLIATLLWSGCALLREYIGNTKVKYGTIIKVDKILGVQEWTVVTWEDGTVLSFLGFWTNEYYINQYSQTLYYRDANPLLPETTVNILINIIPLTEEEAK